MGITCSNIATSILPLFVVSDPYSRFSCDIETAERALNNNRIALQLFAKNTLTERSSPHRKLAEE